MDTTFEPIEYLSGLTSFVFDKATLKRVAIENELHKIKRWDDIDDEVRDYCLIALLEVKLRSPWSSASQTNKHGDFTLQTGAETITMAVRDQIREELKRLYKKYDLDDKLEMLDTGNLDWINEEDF